MAALRILIIPDKFKGTLSAQEAARAIAEGWARGRPQDHLELVPMSDGGDGFGEVVGSLVGATVQRVRTVDAAHEPCVSKWWWEPKTRTAVIESATAIGLAMLPPGKFHPFQLDTLGLAKVIQAAARKGASRCILGIGGSATNDGGFGMARGMGWRFFDQKGDSIQRWTELDKLARIEAPRQGCGFKEFSVAVDVRNPLMGPLGATRVYGPQKGLKRADLKKAERCLRRLALVTRLQLKVDYARSPGAGAAGGLGFGLPAFLGAELTPGFELFAALAKLDGRLRKVDLVITGEGSIDKSTRMGKGVSEIAERCRRVGRPCIGLAGMIGAHPRELRLFQQVHALTELASVEEAKRHPGLWLRELAERVAHSAEWTKVKGRVGSAQRAFGKSFYL